MKLIDEKGKLFGKLNVIDALVLLVVIVAVALVGVKLLQSGQGSQGDAGSAEHWIIYTVEAAEVEPAVYEVVKNFVDAENGKMDQMFASTGLLDAYVIDVQATPHVTYVESADGTVKMVESSGEDDRLDLLFTCVANVENFENNTVGTQEIRANIPHILKTTHFEFRTGVVLSVEWLDSREGLSSVLDLDVLQTYR